MTRHPIDGIQGMQLKLALSMPPHVRQFEEEMREDDGDLILRSITQTRSSSEGAGPAAFASVSLRPGEVPQGREVGEASLIEKALTVAAEANDAQGATGTSRMGSTWEFDVVDKTLNAGLARWAARAGWQLVWELPVDYAIAARATLRGTFEEAVSIVAASMGSAEIPLKAIFYEGNRVLRIVPRGGE